MADLLNDLPTTYAQPGNIRRALGLKSNNLLQTFLASPRLRAQIDAQLVRILGEIPEMCSEDRYIAEFLVSTNDQQFREVACIVTALTQAQAIQRTLSGHTLAAVVALCGGKDILQFVRDNKFPVFAGIRPSMQLDEDTLQVCVDTCECFLLGLLPRNFQLRLLLHRPQDQLRGALEIHEVEAREALKALLRAAIGFLTARRTALAAEEISSAKN